MDAEHSGRLDPGSRHSSSMEAKRRGIDAGKFVDFMVEVDGISL